MDNYVKARCLPKRNFTIWLKISLPSRIEYWKCQENILSLRYDYWCVFIYLKLKQNQQFGYLVKGKYLLLSQFRNIANYSCAFEQIQKNKNNTDNVVYLDFKAKKSKGLN